MIRNEMIKRHIGESDEFRWRGQEVSRLEGFSDAVIAFVITLLVISTEVPKNYNDLIGLFNFSSVGSFAICFVFLVVLWHTHYIFFRRYGFEDNVILALNTAYLFLIALYVYPLKFVFTWLLNGAQLAPAGVPLTPDVPIREDQVWVLMIIYAIGLMLLYLTNLGFYLRAYQKRADLGLNELEIHQTVTSIGQSGVLILVSVISIVVAILGRQGDAGLAGLAYFLNIPFSMIYRRYRRYDGVRTTKEAV